jgi:hypothetical protein
VNIDGTPFISCANARSLVAQQRFSEARNACTTLLELWKGADADLPLLLPAKREYELVPAH